MKAYDHKKIEKKWQGVWDKTKAFEVKDKSTKPKYFSLIEFPYPSGDGLHVGHIRSNTAMDIISRKRRMEGYNVLYPIGWDAFGLPTENYAIKTGIQPSVVTKKNTDTFRRQLKKVGFSFDWSREINTTDPKYYKWTQWIFLQFFKKGLAYKAKIAINWCPKDKIGLANEEVIAGCCERCGTPVEKREKEQWMLAITKYAERLDKDLDTVDYLPQIKQAQRNWIGKSEGVEIDFPVVNPRVKNILILHGKGGSPDTNFIPWIKKELEDKGFKVYTPILPNPTNPSDLEQADFVQKNIPIDEHTVIVGHSFGGVVAMRLLERGIRVHGLVFAGTPVSGKFIDGKTRPTIAEATSRGFDYEKIKKQSDYFKVLFDPNDYVVPREDGEVLAKNLNTYCKFSKTNQPHFCGEEELAILEAILPNIKVFTTRPDTIFGATYLVLAPENPYVQSRMGISENKKEIEQYIKEVKQKDEIVRLATDKEKTGVELKSLKVINPATKEEISVWIADYVLPQYGTGAIMAVPADDSRDKEFAEKFNLPIITEYKKAGFEDFGKKKTTFKLRDWVFSRQRYWGEPIPVIQCDACGLVPVPEKDLPVVLPKVKNYQPTDTGESPLANISAWVNVKCPKCKGKAKRETDTMPNWAGSSWYYLRYTDPKNSKAFAGVKNLKYWTPVDWYNGGNEHTTLHLLYSRFWHKFLFDLKLVPTAEPYKKRTSHGLILAAGGVKMSKSKGNVINPDVIVNAYGADTLRLYEMFMGPFEQAIAWSEEAIIGPRRFLERVWKISGKLSKSSTPSMAILLHKAIKKVSEDIDTMRFNTAVSTFMILVNEMDKGEVSAKDFKKFLQILSPFAPHITEELWQMLQENKSISISAWPKADEALIQNEEIKIMVQVNGKVRGEIMIQADETEEEVKKQALTNENVLKHTENKEIKKVIYVKNRLINIVV